EPLMIEGTLLETTLGEFHWRFLLGEEVADGWEADRVAVSRHELGLSVVAVTEWDSTDAAGHFAEHYVSFLREKGVEPVVKRKGARVLVAYGPGETGEELMRRLLPRDEEQEMERSPSR
ncbi:MAG: hypothetical protein R3338_09060, partial [Thermoanaerobaculia bacterium]|nr:hypothetical protein [Thermoanaerobaculia bacterium]